jgi:tetratricopeptide (TPR) repeat protein
MADVSKRLEKAEKLLQKGKHHDALKELLRATDEDRNNDAIRLQAADLSATLGEDKEAERLYCQVFDKQAATGDVHGATVTYKKLVHLGAASIQQKLRYANMVERTNRDEALEVYRSVASQLRNHPEQAVEVQRRIVALESSASSYQSLAELQSASGHREAAAESFLRAAQQATRDGKHDAAFEHVRRAYEANRENRTARLNYATALMDAGQFEEAAGVLKPLAKDSTASGLYARALMQCGRLRDAQPYFWSSYERDHAAITMLGELMSRQIASGDPDAALALAHRLEVRETGHRRRRDFILLIKDVVLQSEANVELLAYLAELLNSANREHDYCEVLGRLFDLYFASGQFEKAAEALDRAAEVDAYDQANQRRLSALKGKVNDRRYAAVANRFGNAPQPTGAKQPADQDEEQERPLDEADESNVLEDLMLQAEIFLQYGMRARAVERLERIQRLFPSEHINNAQLRELHERAEFTPAKPEKPPAGAKPVSTGKPATPVPAPPKPEPVAAQKAQPATKKAPSAHGAEDALAGIAEISENIFRQAQVDAVLSAAANDIGRMLEAERCIVALCSQGGPPSAFTEYCGPGVKRSEIDALVNAVSASGKAIKNEASTFFQNTSAQRGAIADAFVGLGLHSAAILRLSARDEFLGLLIAGRSAPRDWAPYECSALSLLAGQVGLAASAAKLRKTLEAVAPREDRTGLLRRNAYFGALMFEISRSMQHPAPLSLALLRFVTKSASADVLQQAAQSLLPYIRQTDVAVSYDQNTLALILGGTPENLAAQAVKKLRNVVAKEKAIKDVAIHCGLAEVALNSEFEIADIATEAANRVESALAAAVGEGGGKTTVAPQPAAAAAAAR